MQEKGLMPPCAGIAYNALERALVAQGIERLPPEQKVAGSNPVEGTMRCNVKVAVLLFDGRLERGSHGALHTCLQAQWKRSGRYSYFKGHNPRTACRCGCSHSCRQLRRAGSKGFYNDLKFHRYVPGFVIQGGDPHTRELDSEQVKAAAENPLGGLGTGGPGYCIKEEYTTNPHNSHEDGALAMARSQMPDSAGSQFYLCLGAQHFLDPNYTVFGQTIEGLEVIDQLRVGDVIESVTIEGAQE